MYTTFLSLPPPPPSHLSIDSALHCPAIDDNVVLTQTQRKACTAVETFSDTFYCTTLITYRPDTCIYMYMQSVCMYRQGRVLETTILELSLS